MSVFTDLIQPGTATVAGALVTGGVSLQAMFLKWLIDRFDKLSADLKETTTWTREWLKDHEEKDQERHEENLYRFEKIAVALAKSGVSNGTKGNPND